VELAIKFVPVNVIVTPVPRVVLVGLMDVSVGARLFTVKVCAVVVPPPGAGFVTVTLTDPAVATSAAGTVTTNCVDVCELGFSTFPPKFTVELPMKFVPVSVIVTPVPRVVLVGLMDVSVGTGLLAAAVNVRWKLVVPPSPRTDETMKKYCVPDVAKNETSDWNTTVPPTVALSLQAICVNAPGDPVTTVRMVSYGLVSVSAVMVPLLVGV